MMTDPMARQDLDRVGEVVRYGKSKMPSFGNVLTPQQIKDLMSYLHTL